MILEAFEEEDIHEFNMDLLALVNMTRSLDMMYREMESAGLMENKAHYKRCFDLFHKKYRDIRLESDVKDSLTLKVFFVGTSMEKLIDLAIGLAHIRDIGPSSTKVYPAEPENRDKIMSRISSGAYLRFFSGSKSRSMFLRRMPNGDIQMVYDPESFTDPKSPDFQLCTYHGCLNGFHREIDILTEASQFITINKSRFVFADKGPAVR
ncbi:hypothetical protein J4460_08965 [Candidatus Woesearchaeota archaeon]|nr:hypothetical protein [Candidatus Woesearchaeota archaeon]HIH37367.1 hypothetical protein [Candidatus Woesearchaeota archaeon]HIH48612.1 hypothetical protein [Candidatus Woesearchaeota archaeon]HIJ03608.1 hypothetical protein [Candidatus Woesearchaeota archaeon]